jgi:predicted Zn-dependent peptidase
MSPIKHVVLVNGLQIIYEKPASTIPISSVQIFCNIGNIHSPPGMNGLPHFIEHMCFEGTKDHPDYNKIILAYKDFGAEWNGYTTQRYTFYSIKCQDALLDKCVKYMSNGIIYSKFDPSKKIKEEKVVVEENIRNSDNPSILLENISAEMLYENTLFQYPTDDISYHKKKYDMDDVLKFYKNTYVPSNMVVSVTSHLPFSKIVDIIKKSDLNQKVKPVPSLHFQMLPYLLIPPMVQGVKYKFHRINKLNTIFLNISFQTCNQYMLQDKYILNIIANILCNSTASRLAIILRQKYGLVYGIKANTNYTECGGDFTITTQFHLNSFIKKGKPSVLPLIIKELNSLLTSGVTQKELTISKNNIKGHLLLELENIETQTNYNGISCLLFQEHHKIVPYSKLYETYYASITRAQIHECIKKYFSLSRMCVAMVSDHVPPFPTIAKECNQLKNV